MLAITFVLIRNSSYSSLAQGHARLMFREEVTVLDALVVVTLMESSMLSAALISADNALHSSFPHDPMSEYRKQGK